MSRTDTQAPRPPGFAPTPSLQHRSARLFLALFVLASSCFVAAGCGPSGDLAKITLLDPEDGQFLKGVSTIRVRVEPAGNLGRILVGVRFLGEDPLWKQLKRDDNPTTNTITIDWDTNVEKDGPYQIEVEVLQPDGRGVAFKSGKVWVVNRIAELAITECKQSPVVAREKLDLTLTFVDALAQLPDTTVELFLEGKSVGKKDQSPYKFSLDLKDFADGQEISLNAVAIRGVYNGATAVCVIRIDRQGPRVRFVSPDDKAKTVPGKFLASLEIEEEFGVKEVKVLADGKVVGMLTSPPFQVPVDITDLKHGTTITLEAVATDRAGNTTKDPPKITVVVDSKAPIVEILTPKEGSQHLGDITFEVKIEDESGVALVDFYIVDENKKRLDNILHTKGDQNVGDIFRAKVTAALGLYGAGKRTFEVVARDARGNITTAAVAMIFGCKDDLDCPQQSPPLRCLGNRCLVPRRLGDQCSFSFSCEPPLICHFGGLSHCTDQKFGICRDDCSNQGCNAGFFCLSQTGGPSVCFPGDPCDPATSNCDARSQCTPWGATSFVCLPIGSRGNGQSCTPYTCTANAGCIKDHVCVPKAGGGTCRRICDRDFPKRDCGTRTCLSFPLRDGGQNSIGYCN